MSKPLSMENLMAKFHNDRAGVYRGETTISQALKSGSVRSTSALPGHHTDGISSDAPA
ncbi:hypothetical protein ACFXI8_23875 [Streptomyces niveus]|uniref:hypothetical protein n=1 Tax=Streptomyces niveus TaxID=193462 RepID=UPI0036D1610A